LALNRAQELAQRISLVRVRRCQERVFLEELQLPIVPPIALCKKKKEKNQKGKGKK
jgi:hypothetical protein